MNKLLGHIVRLTRSITLQPSSETLRPSAQFFPGKHSPFVFPSGIAISWWYTKDTFKSVETVSSIIIESMPEFRDCDPETVAGVVTSTLQEICVDKEIFRPDDVIFGRTGSLFECKQSIPVQAFAAAIVESTINNLRAIRGRRCTVYPVPRLNGPSFTLEDERLGAISRNDAPAWDAFLQRGYEANGWSPSKPVLGATNTTFFQNLNYSYALVAEEDGTQKGARFSSALRLRQFLAVLLSVVAETTDYTFLKCGAEPFSQCLQFPHSTAPDHVVTASDCGVLVPYYLSDITISDVHIQMLESWYASRRLRSAEAGQRIDKCAHFVNRGMNSEDIESYVNYFVALDALLGERGSVEASISAGIKRIGFDSVAQEKVSWLFDLRNELVHGGSRYVSEWPKYRRYYRHFASTPDVDIRVIAMSSLFRAPTLPHD